MVKMQTFSDDYWMQQAIGMAKYAWQINEIPIGSICVQDNQVIGRGFNQTISLCDPTAHAEIIALRNAAEFIGNYRLTGATVYVTLEPCMMCFGALVQARIKRLVWGASVNKNNVKSINNNHEPNKFYLNHKFIYQGGILNNECAILLKNFFIYRRKSP